MIRILDHSLTSVDPRDWTRQDVTHWLTLLALKHQINVHPERFPMNGKGLTILTRDMICDRVPGVDGGQVHDELHSRLQKAIEEQMKRLQEMDSLLRTGLMNQ